MCEADVMTAEVISVRPDRSVPALAALLSERGISGGQLQRTGSRSASPPRTSPACVASKSIL
jgi:CBS domain-containing protein